LHLTRSPIREPNPEAAMSYRSILVHLNNSHRTKRLLDVSIDLAMRSNAHLIGLYVIPPIPVGSTTLSRLSSDVVASGLDAYRTQGAEVQAAFEHAVAGLPIAPEWRMPQPRRGNYNASVLDHARTADLVVAPQKETEWDYGDMFDIPDELAIASGRPTLIVPREGPLQPIGEKILVAWNNSRESARAAFDALPLLRTAKVVRVLVVAEPDKPETQGDAAGAEIGASLARHGVPCVIDTVAAGGGSAGESLLAAADAANCDMLVMGCYGRSRFTEFILGGATRHVLLHARIPVLMAH
jgi:nucleotide-binding universal stress UspA family protein